MKSKNLHNESKFYNELKDLLNRTCQENASDTPDMILAGYMIDCLKAYNNAVQRRDKWWGVAMSIEHGAVKLDKLNKELKKHDVEKK